jgi:peptidoglycan/LPS O-acetylase OafA/YrhL
LTGLRFGAALLVVVHHFGIYDRYSAHRSLLDAFLGAGSSGVDFFFVLSGFILTYTYLTPAGSFRGTRRAYYVARLARIYPVYLGAWVVALFPFLASRPSHFLVTLVANVALLQSWLPWPWAATDNPPSWTLSVEMLFYGLLPFLVPVVGRLARSSALWIALVVCWAAGLALPILCDPALLTAHGPVAASIADQVAWRDPLVRLPQFLVGVCVARLYVTSSRPWRWAAPASLLALGALVAALAASASLPGVALHQGLVTPLAGVLIYALATQRGPLARACAHPHILLLGEASYALYILHEPLWSWLVGSTGGLVADHGMRADLFVLLYLLLAVGASIVAYQTVERPARRWLRLRYS